MEKSNKIIMKRLTPADSFTVSLLASLPIKRRKKVWENIKKYAFLSKNGKKLIKKILAVVLVSFSIASTNQVDILKNDIRLLEVKLKRYEGLSNTYVGDGSKFSQEQLEKFKQYQADKNVLECLIKAKKMELDEYTRPTKKD